MKSILNNVIYLGITQNIKTEKKGQFLRIDCVKVKDEKEESLNKLINIHCSKTDMIELKNFVEELPLIVHNEKNEKNIIERLFETLEGFSNTILDSKELLLILEPEHSKFSLEYLFSKFFIKDENENKALKTMNIINLSLIKFWENPFQYINILSWFKAEETWNWIKFLEPQNIEFHDINLLKKENVSYKKNNSYKKVDLNMGEDLLKDKGLWGESKDGFTYTFRQGQYEMAKRVSEALKNNKILCIEAPTGIGKSLGYLLNGVIFSYNNKDEKLVISTNTKNLQKQLVGKDIPLIIERLGLSDDLSFTEIKGKSNYICKKRLLEYIEEEKDTFNYEDRLLLLYINRFAEKRCGDIEDLDYWVYGFNSINKHLNNFMCEGDLCKPNRCEYGKEDVCYYVSKVEQMKKANIIVVNHSLLSVWPYKNDVELKYVIIDEAHNMIDQCYKAYSNELNSIQLKRWLSQLYDFKSNIGQLMFLFRKYHFLIDRSKLELLKGKIVHIIKLLDDINYVYSCIFNYKSESNYRINYPKKFVKEKETEWNTVNKLLFELKEALLYFITNIETLVKRIINEDEDSKDEMIILIINSYCLKLKAAAECIDNILEQPDENVCYSLDYDKNHKFWMINTVDLNIAYRFKEEFLDNMNSVIFTSATLKINEGFNYFKNSLGLNLLERGKDMMPLTVPPVFKVNERTKVFSPKDMPKYNYLNDEDFINSMSQFIINVTKNFNGNILILFSSINRKNKVMMKIEPMLRKLDINFYDNIKGIEEMKNLDKRTILLGSKGFFEGVDIPGEGLTCVILDKVPNFSPKEPLVVSLMDKALREKKIRANGYAYNYINYPETSIKMKQIFGRILRTKYDYGYFFVLNGLDPNSINTENFKRDMGINFIYREDMESSISLMREDFFRWQRENYKIITEEVGFSSDMEGEFKKRNLKWKL